VTAAVSTTAAATLLGRGRLPRVLPDRSLNYDPGPFTAILLVEGPEIVDAALVSMFALNLWRPNLPREQWWRLGEAYAARIKWASDELTSANPGRARVAVEAMNPPAPHVTRRSKAGKVTESGPPTKEMIELLYVVQHAIGVVHGRYFGVGRGIPDVVTVPPGGNRGEWHKEQYGGTGEFARYYPPELRGHWTPRFTINDGPEVKDRWGKEARSMHHLREAFDVASDAESICRQQVRPGVVPVG
jgi:hypothetical protein